MRLAVNFELANLNPLLVEMPRVPVTRLLGPLRLGLPMEKRLPER